MFGAFALLLYFLVCLAICAGVAIYVAYPARGRSLPRRATTSATQHGRDAHSATPARRGGHRADRRHVRGREVTQRG